MNSNVELEALRQRRPLLEMSTGEFRDTGRARPAA
jgi:hypothetical protein